MTAERGKERSMCRDAVTRVLLAAFGGLYIYTWKVNVWRDDGGGGGRVDGYRWMECVCAR